MLVTLYGTLLISESCLCIELCGCAVIVESEDLKEDVELTKGKESDMVDDFLIGKNGWEG